MTIELNSVSRDDIRQVVVILAGSRTGSSFLFNALTRAAEFLSPTGEETPHYRKAGLGVFSGVDYSDEIRPGLSPAQLERAAEELLADTGVWSEFNIDPQALAEAFIRRIDLQWPDALNASERVQWRNYWLKEGSAKTSAPVSWPLRYQQWVEELARAGHRVEPSCFSAQGPPPQNLALLEEPPFVCPDARVRPTRAQAQELPLLLKTSTNVYRLDFLREIFPNAQFRWVILQRNPAAVVNALMDGWLSSAFHAHDVSSAARLEIAGYSDRVRDGDRYWKFDMPPGWQDYRRCPLSEVCAFQWLSAYRRIDEFSRATSDPVLRVRYEDLLHGNLSAHWAEIARFGGASLRQTSSRQQTPSIMSVTPAAAGKWRKRDREIEPLMREFGAGELAHQAEKLGYRLTQLEDWP